MPQRNPRSEGIGGSQKGKLHPAAVPQGHPDAAEQTAIEDAPGLNSGKRENCARVLPVVIQVLKNQEQLGSQQGRERHIDAQIIDRRSVQALLPRQTQSHDQAYGKAGRNQQPVGGQYKRPIAE